MDFEEKITELNFDLENEEAQKEALKLRGKLKKLFLLYTILSSIGILASIPTFILLLIRGMKSLDATILFTILPLAVFILCFWTLVIGLGYRNLMKEIIILEKENATPTE